LLFEPFGSMVIYLNLEQVLESRGAPIRSTNGKRRN